MMAPLDALTTSLGKPWLLEESGYNTTTHPVDSGRAAQFTRTYGLADANHAAGSLFWNASPDTTTGTHSVNQSFPAVSAAVQARNTGAATRGEGPK